MTYFLPRECPKCEMLIAPVQKPNVGDLAICPRCGAAMIFIEGLMLRLATMSERLSAQIQPT